MSSHYLDRLRISPEERARLADLGAPTPLAVLGIRKAAPGAFDRLLGVERAAEIAAQLASFLGEEEQAILEAPLSAPHPLGASLDEPPEPPRPALSKDETS
jgi:hypothetical protein